MSDSRPQLEWKPEDALDYDATLDVACGALLADLQRDGAVRQAVLGDPRPIHQKLYAALAPSRHPEYAGKYRGDPNFASLVARQPSARIMLPDGGPGGGTAYQIAAPGDVAARMTRLLARVPQAIAEARFGSEDLKRRTAAWAFAEFGAIHPFLDGNGHVQRLFYAAVAAELGLNVSKRWRIHPRCYGPLLGIALDSFARYGLSELELVEEYLNLFLD